MIINSNSFGSRKRSHDDMQKILNEEYMVESNDVIVGEYDSTAAAAAAEANNDDANEQDDDLANLLSESHDIHDHKLENLNLIGTNHLAIPNHYLIRAAAASSEAAATGRNSSSVPAARISDALTHVKPHKDYIAWVEQNILLSPMNASSKKRSPFWQAFHQFNTKHKDNQHRQHHASCNLCGKTVNMGRDNSTTTLSQHLRKCNRELWTQLKSTIIVNKTEVSPSQLQVPKVLGDDTKNNSNDGGTATNSSKDDGNNNISQLALQNYVQVAFHVRFQNPSPEEWPGLIRILCQELQLRMSKESIREIFEQQQQQHNNESKTTEQRSREHTQPKQYSYQAQHQQGPPASPHYHPQDFHHHHYLLLSPGNTQGPFSQEAEIDDGDNDEDDVINEEMIRYTMENNMSHDLHLHDDTLEVLPNFPSI